MPKTPSFELDELDDELEPTEEPVAKPETQTSGPVFAVPTEPGEPAADMAETEETTAPPEKPPSRLSFKTMVLVFVLALGGTLVGVGGYYATRSTSVAIQKVPEKNVQFQEIGRGGSSVVQQIREASHGATTPAGGSDGKANPATNPLDALIAQHTTIGPKATPPPPAGFPPPVDATVPTSGFPLANAGFPNPALAPSPLPTGGRTAGKELEDNLKKSSFVNATETGTTVNPLPANYQASLVSASAGQPLLVQPGTEIKVAISHKVFSLPNKPVLGVLQESVPGNPLLVAGARVLGLVRVEADELDLKRIFVRFNYLILNDGTLLPIQAEAWDKGPGIPGHEFREWKKFLMQMGKDTARDTGRDLLSLVPGIGSRLATTFNQSSGTVFGAPTQQYGSQGGFSGGFGGFGQAANRKPLVYDGGVVSAVFLHPGLDAAGGRTATQFPPVTFPNPVQPFQPVNPQFPTTPPLIQTTGQFPNAWTQPQPQAAPWPQQ